MLNLDCKSMPILISLIWMDRYSQTTTSHPPTGAPPDSGIVFNTVAQIALSWEPWEPESICSACPLMIFARLDTIHVVLQATEFAKLFLVNALHSSEWAPCVGTGREENEVPRLFLLSQVPCKHTDIGLMPMNRPIISNCMEHQVT